MAKYFKASDYYPDDKDIYDFLDSQTRSIDPMLMFLRNRNIFASKTAEKISLQNYISLLYFDWESLNRLVDIVNIRDTEQKVRHTQYGIDVDAETIHSLANTVKNERGESRREVYRITKHGEEIDVHVTYLDIDTSKTRVLQKREKELQLTATRTEAGWSFRHTDNERGKDILKSIIKKIGENISQEEISQKRIEIGHLSDNTQRVSFFKNTMSGMDGFRLIDVSNLKVDRLPRELQNDEETEDEEDIEEKLRKVVMYGIDLFTTREYQDLVRQGFFISGAQWKTQKTDGKGEIVEFSAGFNAPSEGKDFAYKVMGVYRIDDTGNLLQKREKVVGSEKKAYLTALELSAHNALNTIDGESDETS